MRLEFHELNTSQVDPCLKPSHWGEEIEFIYKKDSHLQIADMVVYHSSHFPHVKHSQMQILLFVKQQAKLSHYSSFVITTHLY